jgi:hypothetical protein
MLAVTLAISLPHEISMTATINRPRDLPSLEVFIPAPFYQRTTTSLPTAVIFMYIHRSAAVVFIPSSFSNRLLFAKDLNVHFLVCQDVSELFFISQSRLEVENTAGEIRSASGQPRSAQVAMDAFDIDWPIPYLSCEPSNRSNSGIRSRREPGKTVLAAEFEMLITV